jgi:monoamine oxidase
MSVGSGEHRAHQDEDAIPEVDVAVIGAGVAGCYTAWRLQTMATAQLEPGSPLRPLFEGKDRLKVALFEYSDRIGGRLWSGTVNGVSDVCVEFGGMRFYKQMHIVWSLIEALGLGPYVMEFPVSDPENVVYVRGRHLRRKQIAEHPDLLPYRFHGLERERSSALTRYVCEMAIPGFSALRAHYDEAFENGEWEKVRQLGDEYEVRKFASSIVGRTVYELSWWELQTLLLSHEAFEYQLVTSGYDVTTTDGNAAHALDEIFYSPVNAPFYCLHNGYEALPDALHQEFHEHGGATYLFHQLNRFDKVDAQADGGPYNLHFHRRDVDGRRANARAKLVVLAMPVHSLRLLDQHNFFFHPSPGRDGGNRRAQLTDAMDAVLKVPAFKLFLAYDQPWWKASGMQRGQSVTDLPLRQCYYWPLGIPADGAPTHGNAIVMASYNSGNAVPYWAGLQAGPLFKGDAGSAARNDPFKGRAFAHDNRAAARCGVTAPGATGSYREVLRTATRSMVERAHAQLMEMHGIPYAPPPYDAHFQDWTVDPYGAGWHQWKAYQPVQALIRYMQRPLEEENVFVVGECWSDAQGWVQGALNTSEAMLQDVLGLKWPAWLPRGGTSLGPRRKSATT